MNQRLGQIALLVKEYDEAIRYYTQVLEFELLEDTDMGNYKRWVRLRPKGKGSCEILLARAKNTHQQKWVGNQSGGRVFLFLYTDDFWRDYRRMQTLGVKFEEEPREETYGTVVVFQDLYGNKWDFIQERA